MRSLRRRRCQPDCLILASLREMLLDTRGKMVTAGLSGQDDASERAAGVAQLSELAARLPAVLETLERRRAQGTLRAGRCHAHEVAWLAEYMQAERLAHFDDKVYASKRGSDEGSVSLCSDEVSMSLSAHYVGVAAYFAAARTAVSALMWLVQTRLRHDLLATLCMTFIEHALQFALQPESRIHSDQTEEMLTSVESFFLHSFRDSLLPCLKPEAPECVGVMAAWHDLERNGPLLHDLLGEQLRADLGRLHSARADAQAAKDARVPLRTCALPACGAREAHMAHFKTCGACGSVVYCSKAHQTEHWPEHKAACKAARKAAAAKAAGQGGASSSQQQDDA